MKCVGMNKCKAHSLPRFREILMVLIRLRPTIGVYIIPLNETGLNPSWAHPRAFGDQLYCQTSFGCQDSVITTRWSPRAVECIKQSSQQIRFFPTSDKERLVFKRSVFERSDAVRTMTILVYRSRGFGYAI